MYNTLLFLLAELSIGISLLILFLLLFQRLFGKIFTARCRYIIWSLVVLRLCIPFGTPFLPALLEISLPEEIVQTDTSQREPVSSADTVPVPYIPSYIIGNDVQETDSLPLSDNKPSEEEAEKMPISPVPDYSASGIPEMPETEESVFTFDLIFCLFCLWLGIAFLLFIIRLTGYLMMSVKLRKSMLLPDAEQTALYRRLGVRLGIRKEKIPRLYVTRAVHSPMLCGYFRPIILLPDIPLTANQLTGVLAHELTHYRRNDLWIKLAGMTAVSLHWFNPLAYLAVSRCNREMELSCDELVLSGMDEGVRMSYGKVMLHIIQQCQIPASDLTTHFNPRTSAVKERFVNILDATVKKRGRWITLFIAAACITAGSLVAFGSDETTRSEQAEESKTVTEVMDDTVESPENEEPGYPISITPGQTVINMDFTNKNELYPPIYYGDIDLSVVKNGKLPIPVNTAQDIDTLYYYNQISALSEDSKVFAVTGNLFSDYDSAYAYVFCQGDDGSWTVTALPCTGDNLCKGVILREIPMDSGNGWLLVMIMDNGGMQFFRSEDGSCWTGRGDGGHFKVWDSWAVQFSKHSGIGDETLCLVLNSPDSENEQIWLSFDWGISFTQYEIPVLETLPGDYTDIRYLMKTNGSERGEYGIIFEVSNAEENRYVRFSSLYGSVEGTLTFCNGKESAAIKEKIGQEYRYTSPEDSGGVAVDQPTDTPLSPEDDACHTVVYYWQMYRKPKLHLRQAGSASEFSQKVLPSLIGISFTYPDAISAEDVFVDLFYLDTADRGAGAKKDNYYYNTYSTEDIWGGNLQREAVEYFTLNNGNAVVYENVVNEKAGVTYRGYSIRVSEEFLVRISFVPDCPEAESVTRAIASSIRLYDNSGLYYTITPAALIPMLEAYVERRRECQKLSLWDGLPVDESAEPVEIEYGRYVPIAENSYGIHTADDLTRIEEPLLYGTSSGGLGIYEGPVYGDDGQIVGGSTFRMINGKLYVNLDREIIYDETLDMDYSTLRDICMTDADNIVTFTCCYGEAKEEKQYTLRFIDGELYW